MDCKVPIVRAFWGVTDYSRREIFQCPIFSNETVFVWGNENNDLFKSRGFNTVLMSEFPTDPAYSTVETQYYHKLKVLVEAEKYFNEFILLDWDSFLCRPIDDNFYNRLRTGNEVQVPLYAYPNEDGIGLIKRMKHSHNERYNIQISDDLAFFFKGQESQLRKYSWQLDDMLISPNFNFCYTRRPGFGAELIEVAKSLDIKYCVEENAMFKWADCNLEEYARKFEPSVVQGTSDDTRTLLADWNYETDAVYKFNRYIEQLYPKSLYFKHI